MFAVDMLSQFKAGDFFDKLAERMDIQPHRYGLVVTDPYAVRATERIMRVVKVAQEATDVPVEVLGPVPGLGLWVVAIPITYPVTRGVSWQDILELAPGNVGRELPDDPGDVCPCVVAVEVSNSELADLGLVFTTLLAGLSAGTAPHQAREGYDRSRLTPDPVPND